jgi:hypothetical protein
LPIATLSVTLVIDRYVAGLTNGCRPSSRRPLRARWRGRRQTGPDVSFADWDNLDRAGRRELLARHLHVVFVAHFRLSVADRVFICSRGDAPDRPTAARQQASPRHLGL